MFQNMESSVVHESPVAKSNFTAMDGSVFYFSKDKHKIKLNQYDIHETLQDDLNLYMVLDFLPGGELFKQIRK